jgi:hypothetical protein
MPMTRELKKRFMGIEDRLEKIEKRKPIQRTNGGEEEVVDLSGLQEHLDQTSEFEERVANIEAVLQIPGETDGDVQVLSAWRQVVENILTKLEDRILQVELRGAWTPDEAKDLETRVKHLVTEINDHRKRIHDIESKPVAGALSNITQKMTDDIREHEVELFGSEGTGNGLKSRIDDLTKTVTLLNRGVGFIMGPIIIILILIRLITLLF